MRKQGRAMAIFEAAFSVPRDARSEAYKAGVLDVLRHRLGEVSGCAQKCEFTLGTAEADAYFAGCDEGHRRASDYLNTQKKVAHENGFARQLPCVNLK